MGPGVSGDDGPPDDAAVRGVVLDPAPPAADDGQRRWTELLDPGSAQVAPTRRADTP